MVGSILNDVIEGDDDKNSLSGTAGNDVIFGYGGDDIIQIEHGDANGGVGNDIYVISAPTGNDSNVTIIDSGINEASSILLPYKVNDITSIELVRNDVIIRASTSKYSVEINLKNAYHINDSGDKKILSHNYIFTTSDGLLLKPKWPQELNANLVQLPSGLEMTAYYNYLANKDLYKDGEIPLQPERIKISIDSPYFQYIEVGDRRIYLPTFINPALESYNSIPSEFFGGNGNDKLSNVGAGDFVQVEGGNDIIEIANFICPDDRVNKTLTIDCSLTINSRDDDKENTLTLILNDISAHDLQIKNFINSSRFEINQEKSLKNSITIQLNNPSALNSIYGKKLITLIDKNKSIFYIEDKGDGYKLLEASPANINVTEGNDHVVIPADYRLENEILEMGKGNDTVSDLSCRGHTLNGNQGDDVIWEKSGNNRLNGGHGNDQLFSGDGDDRLYGGLGNDTLCSGNGIDYMSGGEDNDIYIIEKGQGETTINDDHGKNTIIFDGTDYRELWFKKRDNKLLITIEGTEKKVVISNYVSGKGASSEFSFQTNSHKIEGDNLNLLIDYMTRTPEIHRNNIQDPGHGMYSMDFNRAWSLIVA